MYYYRDTQGGDFFLDSEIQAGSPPGEIMPFLRFAGVHGFALDLWTSLWTDEREVLYRARLDWRVDGRDVFTTAGDGKWGDMHVPGYRALVRPDTGRVLSVVTSSYKVAENESVARAAAALGQRFHPGATLIAAAGFGRDHERTIFAVRVHATDDDALVLLAYNTHGGDGAVRFQLIEVDRNAGTILAPASENASLSVPHVGDVEGRLRRLRSHEMVDRYVTETRPVWAAMKATRWTPDATAALLAELWGTPTSRPTQSGEVPSDLIEQARRNTIQHVAKKLDGCLDAREAYRRVCSYLDNESQARERGDFTKDRDERLALGAGLKLKQKAWRWIVANPPSHSG